MRDFHETNPGTQRGRLKPGTSGWQVQQLNHPAKTPPLQMFLPDCGIPQSAARLHVGHHYPTKSSSSTCDIN